jgi:hypothetical protein
MWIEGMEKKIAVEPQAEALRGMLIRSKCFDYQFLGALSTWRTAYLHCTIHSPHPANAFTHSGPTTRPCRATGSTAPRT